MNDVDIILDLLTLVTALPIEESSKARSGGSAIDLAWL